MVRLVILRLLESYYRHRWLYLLPILLMGLAGIAAFFMAKPAYISRGVLYVQRGSLLATLTSVRQDTLTFITPAETTTHEMMDLMETDAFVRAIIRQTDLEAEMNGGPTAVRRVMREVRKAVWMEGQGDNQVMVAAAYEDPQIAYQLATAAVESFIQWRINADRAESVAAQLFFAEVIQTYQEELDTARREMENYLEIYPEPLRGERPTSERLQIARLEAAIDLAADRYASALDKEENARLATAQAESDVRQSSVVIDAPRPPDRPERSLTNILLEGLLFVGAGVTLSAIALAGSALFDRSLRFPIDVRHHLNLPVLSIVPGPATIDATPFSHQVNLPIIAIVPGTLHSRKLLPILNQVRQVCVAGEKGFTVASENVANPGLKMIFQSYAQERAHFAAELEGEGARRGISATTRWRPLAAIHRGWLTIKAAMTIGEAQTERVVLQECIRGERAALRSYQHALQRNLPDKVCATMQRHVERIHEIQEELRQMNGTTDMRLLPHLFKSLDEAEQAMDSLTRAGFEEDRIGLSSLSQVVSGYEPARRKSQSILESVAAGAVVGGLLGLLMGLIISAAMIALQGLTPAMTATTLGAILGTAVAGVVIGLLFGGLMGLLIGLGISQSNSPLHANKINEESILMTLQTDPVKAETASRILMESNGTAAHEASNLLVGDSHFRQ